MNKFFLVVLILLINFNVNGIDIIPAKKLFSSPDMHSFKLSPNGKFVAGRVNDKKQATLMIINTKTIKPYSIVDLPYQSKIFFKHYEWISDDTLYIQFDNASVKKHTHGIIHLTQLNSEPIAKFKMIESRGYLVNPLISEKNKVLFSKENNDRGYQLYKINILDLENNDFSKGDKLNYNLKSIDYFYSDESNKMVIGTRYLESSVEYWILNKNKKEWTKFYSRTDLKNKFEPVGLIGKNKMAVLSNKLSDLITLYSFDLSTKKLGKIIYRHEKYDLTGASIEPTNQKLKSVSYINHGIFETQYFSDKNKKINNLFVKAFKDKQVFTVSKNFSGKKEIIKTFSSSSPGQYYIFEPENLIAKLIAYNYEELEKYNKAKSKVFNIKTQDGNTVEAIFTKPIKNSNNVLLVIPHGGPIGVRDYAHFDTETQYYVSRGFSVLKVNFRGSSGFGKNFKASAIGQFGKIIEQDISSAVQYIKNIYHFEKACAMGSSYGGYSAVMLAITHPKDYHCVVAKYGIYDLPLLYSQTNLNSDKKYRKKIENVVGDMRDELWQVSPLYQLEKLQTPILLIAGEKDKIAHFEHSRRMLYRLKQLSKDYESLFYKRAKHGHSHWFGEQHENAYTDNFIRRKLKLGKPKGKNIKEIKIENNLLFADGYSDNSFIKENNQLAFDYYKKAAVLGEPRAQFNIGSYYHRGEIVDFDLKQAEIWYKKSANNQHALASYRLGEMYAQGLYGDEKKLKALDMLNQAKQHGNELAYLEVAKYYCINGQNDNDFKKCFEPLKLNKNKNHGALKQYKNERIKRNNVLNYIAWYANFKHKEIIKLKELLTNIFNIDTFNLEADVEDEGVFEYFNSNYFRRLEIEKSTLKVAVKKDVKFGVELDFSSPDSSGRKNNRSTVKVLWTTPKIIDKFGQEIVAKPHLAKVNIGIASQFYYQLGSKQELVEGDWKLEIYSLDNKKLYEQTFTTYFL